VIAIAARYMRRGVSLSDLIAEGNLGLVEAVRRFDLDRDVRFATYATWWIRARVREYALDNRRIVSQPSTRGARRLLGRIGELERALTQQNGCVPTRAELARASGTTAGDVALVQGALGARDMALADEQDGGVQLEDDHPSAESSLIEREQLARVGDAVAHALDALDRRERAVIKARFLAEDRQTLSIVGAQLGLSRERVRQIEKIAAAKLRAMLEERVGRDA
jgi:RNA polymerase sigma-32 factor